MRTIYFDVTGCMPALRAAARYSIIALFIGLLPISVLGQATPAPVKANGRRITYQGRITGNVADVQAVRVQIFPTATGGSAVWPLANKFERHPVVPDPDGGFVIIIGATEVDGDNDGEVDLDGVDPDQTPLFLQLTLEQKVGNNTRDIELRPRQRIYPAFHASTVDIANRVRTNGVDGTMIQASSIRTEHIADGQVKASDIGTGEVKAAEIDKDAVGTEEIDDLSVQGGLTGDIKLQSINVFNMADNSIGSAQIVNGGVHGKDINSGALSFSCDYKVKDPITCLENNTDCPTESEPCPDGAFLTGGGCGIRPYLTDPEDSEGELVRVPMNGLRYSGPNAANNAWLCRGFMGQDGDDPGNQDYIIQARRICCSFKINSQQ